MKHLFRFSLILIAALLAVSCSSDNELLLAESQQQTRSNEPQTYEISRESARAELLKLLQDIDGIDTRSMSFSGLRTICSEFTVSLNETKTRSNDSNYFERPVHIFNFDDNRGYAVMSGDKRLPSLIALTESGKLQPGDEIDNPGMALFMTGTQIMPIDTTFHPIVTPINPGEDYKVYGEWQNTVYNGMCPVKWGQGAPYNAECPMKSDGRALTGCVATAVAQLMACHKHPLSYDIYNYDWNALTAFPKAKDISPSAQTSLALLMRKLGIKSNLDMDYASDGSGADTGHVPRTLVRFSYSNGGAYVSYETNNVVNEIKSGYPMVVSGKSSYKDNDIIGIHWRTYGGGHAWLIHGLLERTREVKIYNGMGQYKYSTYETLYYPNCNWGWDGDHDGYFLSGVFDVSKGPVLTEDLYPGSPNNILDNYQYKVKVVSGIRK